MFVVVLDTSMVNLAGFAIRDGLNLSATELTVVVDAYLIAFAGLLLLGGRLADVFGGRRIFLIGMAIYVAASAFCAVAVNAPMLIVGRVGQGIGAAVVIPAALALVLALYRTRTERTKALGIWGAVTGLGSLTGVFLGGTITEVFGWPAVFWAPVPVGVVVGFLIWRTLPRFPGTPGRFDGVGAATITLSIAALALGFVSAAESGWVAPASWLGLLIGVISLGAFIRVEARSSHPLVPLSVFTRIPVVVASVMVLAIGATMTSMFFFLPLYQQEVLGMDGITTGLTQIPLAVMTIASSALAPVVAQRMGIRPAIRLALVLMIAGLMWLTLNPETDGFSLHLLGAFLLLGSGIGMGMVNTIAMAVRDSDDDESGLLSGLVNAAQALGGALGLAALAGIAIAAAGSHTEMSFTAAFLGGAALVLIALTVSLIPLSRNQR
ncbi:MFS transporter [Nesterenkonia sp. Hz 6-5]|nr:MFS transporter [Nesterenkonia haasae]